MFGSLLAGVRSVTVTNVEPKVSPGCEVVWFKFTTLMVVVDVYMAKEGGHWATLKEVGEPLGRSAIEV